MGKSKAPAAPDYKGQALAEANSAKFNQIGPLGSSSWSIRPGADPNNPRPGDYIQTSSLSPEQQKLYDLQVKNQLATGNAGAEALEGINEGGDTQALQDALYRRATQYYDTNFGKSQNALETKLQNQGVTQGSEAWNNALEQFNQGKNSAYADATDRAITKADETRNMNLNSNVSRLASLLALSRGQSPAVGGGMGGGADLTGAAQGTYNAQLAGTNVDNANAASTNQSIGSAAAMAAAYFF